MQVDEARRKHAAEQVDRLGPLGRREVIADRGDPTLRDFHVRPSRLILGPVVNVDLGKDEISHPGRVTTGRRNGTRRLG